MRFRHVFVALLALAFAATPLQAYEILLDLDTDNDPDTIETFTYDTSAVVKLILKPDYPGEMIDQVAFGLGGGCRECDHVHEYGVDHDLVDYSIQPWIQASGFDSGWDAATLLGCPGNPGYHLLLWFEPIGGHSVSLNQAIYLAEFGAWVPTPEEGCPRPPSTLSAFDGSVPWNTLRLDGQTIPNDRRDWGTIKALYR